VFCWVPRQKKTNLSKGKGRKEKERGGEGGFQGGERKGHQKKNGNHIRSRGVISGPPDETKKERKGAKNYKANEKKENVPGRRDKR